MEKLIIVGAGGMSLELISLIKDINLSAKQFEICGILDDNPELLGTTCYDYKVIGPIIPENVPRDCLCVLGVATSRNIALRSTVGERLGLPKERWANLIHPQATVAEDAELDYGVILYPGVRLSCGTKVGFSSFLYYNSVLHHESTIGSYSQICAGVLIAGRSTVGSRCYLGIGSIIRDNIAVADNTLIGMGSVVTKSILHPGQVVKGNPAQAV